MNKNSFLLIAKLQILCSTIINASPSVLEVVLMDMKIQPHHSTEYLQQHTPQEYKGFKTHRIKMHTEVPPLFSKRGNLSLSQKMMKYG